MQQKVGVPDSPSETIATRPAFRESFKYRRCLVAADGWYEWRITPAGKVSAYIQRVTAVGQIAPFFYAGLWASWRDKSLSDAEPRFSAKTPW